MYLDASALVKAFVEEEGRHLVLELLATGEPAATSRLAFVECEAAFARAGREGRLSRRQVVTATSALSDRWNELVVVELNERHMKRAGALMQEHSVRAGDAIHLASALSVAEGRAEKTTFACWDERLWDAASSLRFTMVPATRPT